MRNDKNNQPVTPTMQRLVEWAREQGAWLHPDVEVYEDARMGFGLRVRPDQPADKVVPSSASEALVSCPMGLSFSYVNAIRHKVPSSTDQPLRLAPFRPLEAVDATVDDDSFPEAFLEETDPSVVGRFALVREYLRGEASFWAPYIVTLPSPVRPRAGEWAHRSDDEYRDATWSLPPYWDEDDLDLLDGTNMAVTARELRQRIRREYEEALSRLRAWSRREQTTLKLYQWAHYIFSSRSFNPKLVLNDLDAVLDVLPFVSEENDGDGPQKRRATFEDFSLLLPLYDIANHSMTAETMWVTDAQQQVAFVTKDVYRPGEQIFNNYGLKSNSQLLLSYEFMMPESESLHNDYVHLWMKKDRQSSAKPQDYLLSLRPVYDASSVLARSRSILYGGDGGPRRMETADAVVPVHPCFTYIDDRIVWDMTVAQIPVLAFWNELLPEKKTILTRLLEAKSDGYRELVTNISTTATPALPDDLDEQIHGALRVIASTLFHKAMIELEKLNETDWEVANPDEAEALTRPQRHAYIYRQQVRQVLMNVLESVQLD